jgi:beta-phosphoglucomutase family hydrolase
VTHTAADATRPRASDPAFTAVIFDMDGVVTDTAGLHAAAWQALFDQMLPVLADGGEVEPFDVEADYHAYIDGRSREDGVRAFLASRGLGVPEGSGATRPGKLTVLGLAARKQQIFAQMVAAHGVAAYPSTVALLHRLKAAGVATALVTASRNSGPLLSAAGVTDLFDAVVDGTEAATLHLAGKPAPDMFCEAARRLGVQPAHVVVIEDAAAGVLAAAKGGFGRTIGIDRGGNRARLQAAGADLIVTDLAGVDVTAFVLYNTPWCGGADLNAGPWLLTYDGYDPDTEGIRETLCTLANGYWGTRGAAPQARAGGVHYPGSYLAGVYNRLDSTIGGTVVQEESMVNIPNWLPLTLHHADGVPLDADHGTLQAYRQELDLRRGLLIRSFVHEDTAGRATRITERRLVSQAARHLAALETSIEALNWSGSLHVRSALDGNVGNTGVAEYQHLASRHLLPPTTTLDRETVLLETATSQSGIRIALAARTRVHCGGVPIDPSMEVVNGSATIGHEFQLDLAARTPVTVEKVAAVATSHDRAISTPVEAACFHLQEAGDFSELLTAHERAWRDLWDDFAVTVTIGSPVGLALNLHTFHVLQATAGASSDLDAGITARGLHGEGYRGHVFWDEMFVYPLLTLRRPQLTRDLLAYRYRRLESARAAARAAGLSGAMFPWQSASDGREETPTQLLNLISGTWLADNSHRQRHVGLAIAYSLIQYQQTTGDMGFLAETGGELLIEICRLFAALAVHDPGDDRFHIDMVMGPDEFHDGYPGRPGSGVQDNAYTNILTAWLLYRTIGLLQLLDGYDCGRLRDRLQVSAAEIARWEQISRGLAVPFHADGIISQFEGYEHLQELDFDAHRARYANIGRLDLILAAEGDSPNNYRVSKQADVLMLFYLLSAEELRMIFARLGYSLSPDTIRGTVDFYTPRTSHGSTLSRVVHAWVNARADRHRAWTLFTEALQADLADTQGGTTREGIHLGAMAGTVDLVMRCFTGLETRDNLLWLHPALPPELSRAEFSILYRGQQVKVELTPRLARLRLRMCDAAPIKICVEGQRATLHPGEVFETPLREHSVPADHPRTEQPAVPNKPHT